jgi:large subunit ribosomal protein L24e
MPKCVYCGKEYDIPKGMTLFLNDGTVNTLCSSKCRKNMKMKRRKVRWISKKKKQKKDGVKEETKKAA